MSNIDGIKSVMFIVEGNKIDTLKGFLDLTHPIKPNDDIYIRRKYIISYEKK